MRRAGIFSVFLTLSLPFAGNATELQIFTRVKEILELLETGKDIHDKGNEVADGLDYLCQLTLEVDGGWQELANHASSFHPKARVQMPKIDGDEAFSTDPERRKTARETWDHFVREDREEIDRLRQRYDQQQTSLAAYQKRLDAVSKAKKLFDDLSKDPTTPSQYEMAKKAVEFHVLEITLTGIVGDFKRIVKEYNTLLDRKEKAHEGHLRVKAIFDQVKDLPSFPPTADRSQAPQTQPLQSNSKDGKSIVEQRIGNAVDAGGGEALSNAASELARLKEQHREVDIRNEGTAAQERAVNGRSGGADGLGSGIGFSQGGGPGQPSASGGPSGAVETPRVDDDDFQVIILPKPRK